MTLPPYLATMHAPILVPHPAYHAVLHSVIPVLPVPPSPPSTVPHHPIPFSHVSSWLGPIGLSQQSPIPSPPCVCPSGGCEVGPSRCCGSRVGLGLEGEGRGVGAVHVAGEGWGGMDVHGGPIGGICGLQTNNSHSSNTSIPYYMSTTNKSS